METDEEEISAESRKDSADMATLEIRERHCNYLKA